MTTGAFSVSASIAASPAAVVPPGVTTIWRSSSGESLVSVAVRPRPAQFESRAPEQLRRGKPVFSPPCSQRFDHCVNESRPAAGERRHGVDLFLRYFDDNADRAENFPREIDMFAFRLFACPAPAQSPRGKLPLACSSSRA